MLIRIGDRAGGEGDVVDSLLACHARIRKFLVLAARAGQGLGAEAERADAARQIRRYFIEAMPLHVADEEDSLLPRLTGRAREVDAALRTMQEQHSEHGGPLADLTGAADRLALDPADGGACGAIAAAAAGLEAALIPHLDLEEAVILPAVRRLLDAREIAEIAREMRARRAPPGSESPRPF